MRISPFQKEIILEGVEKFCGNDARVWLFGSRVNDLKRGGDIDLYIEVSPKISVFEAKLRLLSFFEIKFGEQKIDILIRVQDQKATAMHEIAKSSGIELVKSKD